MAKNLSRLRAERDDLVDKVRRLNAQYPEDKRMPEVEARLFDSYLDRIKEIDEEVASNDRQNQSSMRQIGLSATEQAHRGLRTAAEFRQHYSTRGGPDEEQIGVADFLRGVAGMGTSKEVRQALSEGTDSAGGYAVPNRLMPAILEALVPASSLLTAGASTILIEEGYKTLTQATVQTIPTAAWRLEGGTVAQSEPTFQAITSAPKSLAFYFKISRELLADGSNLSATLTQVIAQAFAKELDRAGLRGTGVDPEPLGLKNIAGIQTVTNGAAGASLAGFANFLSAMQSIVQDDAPAPTAAIMSPRSFVKLGGLVDTTGQPLSKPEILQDVQFIASSQVPNNLTVGASTDCSEIYVGRFDRMAFVMREQMSVQILNELFASTGEIGFLAHARANVVVDYPKAFALVTGVRP